MKNKLLFLSFNVFVITSTPFNMISTDVNIKHRFQKKQASDDQTVKDYHNSTYNKIFTDTWNSGLKGNNGNTIDYDWTGAFGTPTWGKLNYNFSSGYSYLMNKFLYQEDNSFYNQIKEWVAKNSDLSNNLKIKILIDLLINYIKIGNQGEYRQKFLSYSSTDNIQEFLNVLYNLTIFKNTSAPEIVRGSLINIIKSMKKSQNAQWVNDYIVDEYTKNGEDKPYDGGVNFFIYYNSQKVSFFMQLLFSGSCFDCNETSQWTHHYYCKRTFWSERTSGGNNYLSCVRYDFPQKKVSIMDYRPGRDII